MTDTINNGGPAFPSNRTVNTSEGMTLRDYFAAKALQGMLAADALMKAAAYVSPEENERLMAEACYAMADAMLRAREAALASTRRDRGESMDDTSWH